MGCGDIQEVKSEWITIKTALQFEFGYPRCNGSLTELLSVIRTNPTG